MFGGSHDQSVWRELLVQEIWGLQEEEEEAGAWLAGGRRLLGCCINSWTPCICIYVSISVFICICICVYLYLYLYLHLYLRLYLRRQKHGLQELGGCCSINSCCCPVTNSCNPPPPCPSVSGSFSRREVLLAKKKRLFHGKFPVGSKKAPYLDCNLHRHYSLFFVPHQSWLG